MKPRARVSPVPGDLVRLLTAVGDYRRGSTARVIAVPDAEVCVVEFEDGRQLTVAGAALKIAPWSSLGG
jgi:hypothetical protein